MQHVVRAAAGSTAELQCQATGSPKPRLSWTQSNGKGALHFPHWSLDGDKLVIGIVSLNDSGTYICTASNGISTASAQIAFEVHGEKFPAFRVHTV